MRFKRVPAGGSGAAHKKGNGPVRAGRGGSVREDGCPPLQGLAYGSTRKRGALFRANLGGTADASAFVLRDLG